MASRAPSLDLSLDCVIISGVIIQRYYFFRKSPKICPGKTGVGKDSPREGRPPKIGFREIGVGEVGAGKVGRRKVGLTEVGRLEIPCGEVGLPEVWSNVLILTPPLIPRSDALL